MVAIDVGIQRICFGVNSESDRLNIGPALRDVCCRFDERANVLPSSVWWRHMGEVH